MEIPGKLTEDEMRAAVANRDRSYAGRFIYAVITTGVYCRPGCAARLPRPEHLRFFLNAQDAVAAGFRPCKRCKPDDFNGEAHQMIELARYIEAHADQKLLLADLAARQGLSPAYLQKAFKSVFGVSPKVYQDAMRINRFKNLLKEDHDVTDAIFAAGYGSSSRVYGKAVHHMGMTPRSYQQGGAGEQITFACRTTAVGLLMMATTDRGVCFAMFGETEVELLDQLRSEFPKAELMASQATDSVLLEDWIVTLDAHLSEGGPRPDIPLDLRGTAFQIKVWQFLLSIPDGEVVSYGEVASGVDRPTAIRAAASACGKNRIAVLVPCHRVLRGDGGLGGYRWGVERKQVLLDVEGQRKGQDPVAEHTLQDTKADFRSRQN